MMMIGQSLNNVLIPIIPTFVAYSKLSFHTYVDIDTLEESHHSRSRVPFRKLDRYVHHQPSNFKG